MSIIRVGLSETNKFAEGYDAIFGGKKKAPAKKPVAKAAAKKRTVAKPKKRK